MAEDVSDVDSFNFLPENLRDALMDFQKQGVKFGIRNQGRCLVGDEMGLGKTLQALSIAYYYKNDWPVLIVVPSSMKYPWIEEIEKWITDLEPGDINLIRSGTDIGNISTSKISILGYGLCVERKSSQLLVKVLKEQVFKVIVLDESHYLKNRTTGRTKLLHPIARSAKRTILLTGTPSLARPEELYAQLDMVCPGEFGSFSDFATRYCEAHYEFIGKIRKWNTRGACNLDELHRRLHNRIMIRRLKKNVLTQLPPKRRQKITFDIPDSDYKKDLLQAKGEFMQYHQTLKSKETVQSQKTQALFEMNRLSTVLYHYTGLAKAGSVQQYVSDLLDGMDNKFLVFCRHKQVITAVIQQLAKKNVRYICIDGSVAPAIRGSLVNQFQNNPLYRVAVLSIEAASFGLTLTAADHVVFAELHFTPGVMMQAEDRAHRIGQVNAVNVHYLVGRGTMDEVLWGMLKRKIHVTSSALDGKLSELHAEDGDEETSKQLSICAAWLNEEAQEDDEDSSNYLFSQTKRKAAKQIEGQSDLRSFFTPPSKSHQDLTGADSDEELMEISLSMEQEQSTSSCNDSPSITIEDSSDEEELCNEDDLASILIEEDNDEDNRPNQNTSTPPPPKPISTEKTQAPSLVKTASSISNHFYEFSEYTDSEDIFNSYIPTKNDEDEGREAQVNDVEEEEMNCSSSTLSLNSAEEEDDFKRDASESSGSHSRVDKYDIEGPSSLNDDVVLQELKTKNAEHFVKVQKRNPFSLKHKGSNSSLERKRSVFVNKEVIERDSDDDDFEIPMPKYCQDKTLNLDSKDADIQANTSETSRTLQNKENSQNAIETEEKIEADEEEIVSVHNHIDCASSEAISAQSLQTQLLVQKDGCQEPVGEEKEVQPMQQDESRCWSCSACTLLNDPLMIECSICFTPRPKRTQGTKQNACKATGKCDKNYLTASTSKGCNSSEVHEKKRNSVSKQTAGTSGLCYSTEGDITVGESSSVLKQSPVDNDDDDFKEPFGQWSCSGCTFLNDAMLIECSVCMTPRRRSQRRTPSHWSTLSCEKRWQKRKRASESNRKRTGTAKDNITKLKENRCNSSGNEFEEEGQPSLIEQQRQSSRKRLRLENQEISSSITRRLKDITENEDVDNKDAKDEVPNNYNSEEAIGESEADRNPNELMKTEQSAIDSFVLEFSDSDATDDEVINGTGNQADLQENLKEDSLQISIGIALKTADASAKTNNEECVQLDKVVDKPTVVQNTEPSTTETVVENTEPCTTESKQHHELHGEVAETAMENHEPLSNIRNNQQQPAAEQSESLQELQEAAAMKNHDPHSNSRNNQHQPATKQSESLRELQEAAEEIFREESEIMDDFEAIDNVNCREIKKKPKEPPLPIALRFSMSLYTDRVFLYDEDGTFLRCNFPISDVKDNSKEDLPHILQNEHNYKQAKTLVHLWTRLGPQMKRVVVKSQAIFKDPVEAYQILRNTKKESSNVRHWTKDICLKKVQQTADQVGGDVRKVIKSPDRKRRKKNTSPNAPRIPTERGTASSEVDEVSCMQAFGPDGSPLCLFCRAPVDYGSLGNNWDSRFCSFDCKESYQVRVSGTATRRKLFEAEQGICQLCHFDAHACYNNVKALQKKDRRVFLEKSVFADLPPRMLNRMILDPKEGMFWEADHIVAVAEGGGECGIENLRTLCVPCHKKVTKDLLVRLRNKRRTVDTTGTMNITGFLQKKT